MVQECGGDGGFSVSDEPFESALSKDIRDCPSCQDGKVMLVVVEDCKHCKGRGQIGPTNTGGLYCKFCEQCNGKGFHYRPLTVEEVEEWGVELKGTLVSGQPWEHLLCAINTLREDKYTLTHKGRIVKLVPLEGE
jgi:hypothetical protein